MNIPKDKRRPSCLTLTSGLHVSVVASVPLVQAGEGGERGAGEDGGVGPGHPGNTGAQGGLAERHRHHQD